MPDGFSVVFESDNRRSCADRMLVLTSLSIPHELVETGNRYAIVTLEADAELARFELWQYDKENEPPRRPPPASVAVPQHNALPGVVGYVLVICVVAWLAGRGTFSMDWYGAGRVDGERIRDGEWWRTLTALTLHGGLRHLMGNIGFGVLFGLLAGRVVGSGVAWLAIVVASGMANTLNTVLLESSHRSVGASTAVFAALGFVAGFVWHGKLMAQDRWPYRLGPIVGGIALLAYTGTGDENTDIGAHLAGFVCGFIAGIPLTRLSGAFSNTLLQRASGIAALALIAGAWAIALASYS
ncbi:MAG: rhomboid family intramembrane serine protease [Woeseia sp.]